jgi:hypothetical protein
VIEVTFRSEEALKPYDGPDVNQKFPGEDDLVWCERCQMHHRRGAAWKVEQERMLQEAAKQIAVKIDRELYAPKT